MPKRKYFPPRQVPADFHHEEIPLMLKQAIRQLQLLDQLADSKDMGIYIYFRMPDGRCVKSFELKDDGSSMGNFDIVMVPMPPEREGE